MSALKPTFLVVYSYPEAAVRQIAESRTVSATRHGYEMHICYAMATSSEALTAGLLRQRLHAALDDSRAEYLVVHAGFAYLLHPHVFIDAIIQIAETFPQVEIVLDKLDESTRALERTGVLSRSEEAENIRRLTFEPPRRG